MDLLKICYPEYHKPKRNAFVADGDGPRQYWSRDHPLSDTHMRFRRNKSPPALQGTDVSSLGGDTNVGEATLDWGSTWSSVSSCHFFSNAVTRATNFLRSMPISVPFPLAVSAFDLMFIISFDALATSDVISDRSFSA